MSKYSGLHSSPVAWEGYARNLECGGMLWCKLAYFLHESWCAAFLGGWRPWFRQLVAGLSVQRPGFSIRPVDVRSVWTKSCCYNCLSKYFNFLLSVSVHWWSILIHSFITDTVILANDSSINSMLKKVGNKLHVLCNLHMDGTLLTWWNPIEWVQYTVSYHYGMLPHVNTLQIFSGRWSMSEIWTKWSSYTNKCTLY